jgi:hypothetical protein
VEGGGGGAVCSTEEYDVDWRILRMRMSKTKKGAWVGRRGRKFTGI